MSYSKEQEALRSAITNFIGVAASSSAYKNDRARENVISLFVEELVKIGQNEDNTVNMKTLRPLFKSVIWILQCRRNDIVKSYKENFNQDPPIAFTQEIDTLVELLDIYINKI